MYRCVLTQYVGGLGNVRVLVLLSSVSLSCVYLCFFLSGIPVPIVCSLSLSLFSHSLSNLSIEAEAEADRETETDIETETEIHTETEAEAETDVRGCEGTTDAYTTHGRRWMYQSHVLHRQQRAGEGIPTLHIFC